MKMNVWKQAPDIGSYVLLSNYEGAPMLASCPMLLDGTMDDNAVDVSRDAFDHLMDLCEYAVLVAKVLDATPREIIDSIRG